MHDPGFLISVLAEAKRPEHPAAWLHLLASAFDPHFPLPSNMHSLFNIYDQTGFGALRVAEWQWVREGLQRSIQTVVDYFHLNPRAVRSDHFLVRLLGTIPVPRSQNLERYYDNVDAVALNTSMALKMTSSIYPGAIHNGVFYGPGTAEILIAHDNSFDLQDAHKNWKNVRAVQVLRTPRSDFGLNLPNGRASGSETGLAVIAVNVPLLAVQYRAFCEAEDNRVADTDSRHGLAQFVHMYVLPNMLWSQTDQVMFNRLDNLSRGRRHGQSFEAHPFVLPQVNFEQTTRVMERVLLNLRAQNRPFVSMLQSIPAITAESMNEALQLPPMAQTRQVSWALTIARLPALALLVREAKGGPQLRNRADMNAIARSLLMYRSGAVFRQYLPGELLYEVQNEIDQILVLPEVTIA